MNLDFACEPTMFEEESGVEDEENASQNLLLNEISPPQGPSEISEIFVPTKTIWTPGHFSLQYVIVQEYQKRQNFGLFGK